MGWGPQRWIGSVPAGSRINHGRALGAYSSQHGITNSSLPLRRSGMSSYTERDRPADFRPAYFLICFSLRYAIGVGEVGHGLTRDDPCHPRFPTAQAAFSHVNRLAALRGGVLDSADLAGGFDFGGERIPLINPQHGIFKPRQMAGLLSIRTVFPRRGGRVWYEDQREAHRQIYAGEEVVEYAFMGNQPELAG